jgi:hypothetical protein
MRITNFGNSCCYSAQKLLSSSLLAKIPKTRIYKTVILPLALCSRETLPLTVEEECKLQVSENKVIREIFG